MNGVWLSFLASEMLTFVVILILSRKEKRECPMTTFEILLQQIGLFVFLYSGGRDTCPDEGTEQRNAGTNLKIRN